MVLAIPVQDLAPLVEAPLEAAVLEEAVPALAVALEAVLPVEAAASVAVLPVEAAALAVALVALAVEALGAVAPVGAVQAVNNLLLQLIYTYLGYKNKRDIQRC